MMLTVGGICLIHSLLRYELIKDDLPTESSPSSITFLESVLPNTHFYWVGYFSKERYRVNTADIEKLNLSKNIHLIQETTTPEVWLNQSDLFLLTSREDPFPLAAMEAGLSGLPIICFEKAILGGA